MMTLEQYWIGSVITKVELCR